jgi:hypothetical protein
MRCHPAPLHAVGWATLVAASLSLAPAALEPVQDASDANSTTLTYQACEEWSFILPRETWFSAADVCGVPHAGGAKGFACEKTGTMALEVDTNGDGKLDERVKGARGFAKLRGKDAQGMPLEYAVRFKFDDDAYQWSPSGVMTGKIKGQLLRLIDQNGNGEYDDYGVDAMIVGSSEAACFLSKVVNLGGELVSFEVDAGGGKVSVAPYTGETGQIDLASQFKSNGTLIAAVIQGGGHSFNVADARNGLKVPVGTYELVAGFVQKGGETCWIKKGKSHPIEVSSGADVQVAWGGPIVAEFDYSVADEEIRVPPDVKFYGQTGEEYHSFLPEAKSPKILVTDKKTGKLVASGRFGGC